MQLMTYLCKLLLLINYDYFILIEIKQKLYYSMDDLALNESERYKQDNVVE